MTNLSSLPVFWRVVTLGNSLSNTATTAIWRLLTEKMKRMEKLPKTKSWKKSGTVFEHRFRVFSHSHRAVVVSRSGAESKEFTTAAQLVDLVSPTGPNSSLYLALVLDFLSRVMLNLLNLRSFTCIPQCSKKPPRVLAFLDLLLSISQSKQI